MASYFGLKAIAERLELTTRTVMRWHEQQGFPMYPRRKHGRWVWYTNDALIHAFEIRKSVNSVTTPGHRSKSSVYVTTRPYLDNPA